MHTNYYIIKQHYLMTIKEIEIRQITLQNMQN